MFPWREPERDMRAFFPGSTDYATDVLILSRLRLLILKRLGPGERLDSNALYLYRVSRNGAAAGTVLVRRTAGEHGAVEVVIGVDTQGRVAGVRVQRQREPPRIAAEITSSAWLDSFRGKTADSAFEMGRDLPDVTPAAAQSARVLAGAVRALLIEFDVGEHPGGH